MPCVPESTPPPPHLRGGGGGRLPYEKVGDARRECSLWPLRGTKKGVVQAFSTPKRYQNRQQTFSYGNPPPLPPSHLDDTGVNLSFRPRAISRVNRHTHHATNYNRRRVSQCWKSKRNITPHEEIYSLDFVRSMSWGLCMITGLDNRTEYEARTRSWSVALRTGLARILRQQFSLSVSEISPISNPIRKHYTYNKSYWHRNQTCSSVNHVNEVRFVRSHGNRMSMSARTIGDYFAWLSLLNGVNHPSVIRRFHQSSLQRLGAQN